VQRGGGVVEGRRVVVVVVWARGKASMVWAGRTDKWVAGCETER
jgi:hypothetical protein